MYQQAWWPAVWLFTAVILGFGQRPLLFRPDCDHPSCLIILRREIQTQVRMDGGHCGPGSAQQGPLAVTCSRCGAHKVLRDSCLLSVTCVSIAAHVGHACDYRQYSSCLEVPCWGEEAGAWSPVAPKSDDGQRTCPQVALAVQGGHRRTLGLFIPDSTAPHPPHPLLETVNTERSALWPGCLSLCVPKAAQPGLQQPEALEGGGEMVPKPCPI